MCAHSLNRQLIGYRKTSRALQRKEKTGLKLGLEKCMKTKVFRLNFYGIFFFKNFFENLIM